MLQRRNRTVAGMNTHPHVLRSLSEDRQRHYLTEATQVRLVKATAEPGTRQRFRLRLRLRRPRQPAVPALDPTPTR
jgi:hypothetical protein